MQPGELISSLFKNKVSLLTIKGSKFTQREIDIIACLLQGRSQKTIAALLSIAPRTVETHVRNIMLKLECNSSEGIRDSIEKSGNFFILREHYQALLIQAAFEKQLYSLAHLMREKKLICYLVWEEEQTDISALIKKLDHDLRHLGIQPLIKAIKKENFDTSILIGKDTLEKEIILGVALTDSLEKLLDTYKSLTQYNDLFLLLFFTDEKEEPSKSSQEYKKIKYINVQNNYYLSFLEIFKIIYPGKEVENIILSFKEQYSFLQDNYFFPASGKEFFPLSEEGRSVGPKGEKGVHNPQIYSIGANLLTIISSILTIGVLVLGALTFQFPSKNRAILNERESSIPTLSEAPIIHDDLSIPKESAFLNRPLLINHINKALKTHEPIQTVALIGIGGAGKTTIARQYARQQDARVIWEINAETKESLAHSFESLAYALSQTDEERKILREIQEIKNNQEREEKIILFVKSKLKLHSPWFLIYDNVEKFNDIQHHFPHDPKLWGEGRALITTRNHHIQSNTQINHAFEVGDLSATEKLDLFTKIMREEDQSLLNLASPEETIKFVEELPPFPLDISMAARYLLVTNTSYSQYLEYLTSYNADFYLLHQAVLKEASDYDKTRYRIISVTIRDLIDIHPDFKELLFLISVLDSKNIPKRLLDLHKSDTLTDNFIYHLKKYSLISVDTASSPHLSSTYSIHRSTQAIIRTYLTQILGIENNHIFLQNLTRSLQTYSVETVHKYESNELKILQRHLEKFLSHKKFLTPITQGTLQGHLGYIYYKLGNYPKGKYLLKESLCKLPLVNAENASRIALFMVNLASAHWELGEFAEAKNHLEKSIQIYKTRLPDQKKALARAMAHLGIINSELENFGKAEELLQTALTLYHTYAPDHYRGRARILTYLGIVYRLTGKYDQAIEVLKQSLSLYRTYLPHKHISFAWALKNLGNVYYNKGNYKEALSILQQSVNLYEKYLADNQVEIARIYTRIGNVNKELGNYELAKTILEKSLAIYKKHLPENHIAFGRALSYLANIYRIRGNYEKAKADLEKSLEVYSKNLPNHSLKIAWAKMHLGNILAKSGNFADAHQALQSSFEVFEKNYGKNHIELARIISYFGQLYLLEGNLDEAETYLLQALEEFKKNHHTDAYKILEDLAQLYLERSKKAATMKKIQEAGNYKAQAVDYLKQALEIANNNLPDGNPISQNIRTTLQSCR
jgi:tetratricopeptide (TPR) repeat protein